MTWNDSLSAHEGRNKHQCSICDYSYSKHGNLKQHMMSVHKEKQPEEKKENAQKCPVCDYSCSSNWNLKKHMGSVHDEMKSHICHICDFKTSLGGNLKRHTRSLRL